MTQKYNYSHKDKLVFKKKKRFLTIPFSSFVIFFLCTNRVIYAEQGHVSMNNSTYNRVLLSSFVIDTKSKAYDTKSKALYLTFFKYHQGNEKIVD